MQDDSNGVALMLAAVHQLSAMVLGSAPAFSAGQLLISSAQSTSLAYLSAGQAQQLQFMNSQSAATRGVCQLLGAPAPSSSPVKATAAMDANALMMRQLLGNYRP